jgi:hypothetical protein
MKKLSILALLLALAVTPAWAGNIQGQLQDQGQGQGQSQSIYVGDPAPAGDPKVITIPNPAPPVFSPNLVAVPETCMGSVSMGGSASTGPIAFGLNFGKTYVDPDCTLRMYARAVASIGDNDVARALLAQNDQVAQAYAAVGRPVKTAAAAPAATNTAPAAVQEGVQKEKREAAALPTGIVALGPTCGDGRPSVLRADSSVYSCYGWDREGLSK